MEAMVGMEMSNPIELRSFLLEYKDELGKYVDENVDNSLLEEECSLEKLDQPDDPYVSEYEPSISERNRVSFEAVPKEAFDLKTFELLQVNKKKLTNNPFRRTRDAYKSPDIMPANNVETGDIDIDNDLLIWVRVYRPARATHVGQTLENPVFAEEFACLGSNMLSELRDKISCICNGKRFFDISEAPDQPIAGKDTDPGYFFINDTFYNDMRNPQNADYSETVRKWAKTAAGMRNCKFKVAKMEETRFIDLTVSIGFPQQYQHHGNCEHIFTFSQVELLTPHTKLYERSSYPLLTSFSFFNTRVCHMCSRSVFSFVVEGSDRQIFEPAYLCELCFKRFHYIDGKKVGTFRAYRIHDNANNFENDNDDDDDEEEDIEETCEEGEDDIEEPSTSKAAKQKEANNKRKAESEKPKRAYKKRKTATNSNEVETVKTKRTYNTRTKKSQVKTRQEKMEKIIKDEDLEFIDEQLDPTDSQTLSVNSKGEQELFEEMLAELSS